MKFLIFLIFSNFVGTVPTGGQKSFDFGDRESGKQNDQTFVFLGKFLNSQGSPCNTATQ